MSLDEFIDFIIETINETADKAVSRLEDEGNENVLGVVMEDGSTFFLTVEEG